jgi:hypothetical protein
MELLGEVTRVVHLSSDGVSVKSRFGLFRDGVSVKAR